MNNFLLTIAAIFVLVLGALFAIPPFIDWNAYRGTFEEEASRLLDREVRVQGRVSVSILPVPFVSFEKVRIADQTGIAGSFVRADQFKMWLSVPPLLRGIIEARQIELEKPVLRVRMRQDGTGNWQSLRIQESNLAFLPRDVTLNSVTIDDGTVVFEHHTGEEIARITSITGELSAAALRGPYKFVGTASAGQAVQDIRLSTAPLEADGNIRFRGTVRDDTSGLSHTIDGALNDPLARARIEGRLRTQSLETRRAADGAKAGPFEMTSRINLDAEALRLEDIAITFQNKDRLQTLTGSALTSWQDGLVTRTELKAPWLDLDAVAGTGPGSSPLTAIERLITRGLEPLGAGVTSAALDIDQGRLAGATLSGLKARMVRRDGITKVEDLRVTLPGLTALALDGFLEGTSNGLQFDGSAVLRSADLGEFARWLRPGDSVAASLSGAFALNADLRVRPGEITLSDALLDVAGERLEGMLAYDGKARPVLTADLETAAFDTRRLGRELLDPGLLAAKLGFADVGATPAGSGDLKRVFAGMDLVFKLRAGSLTDGRRTFRDVRADLERMGDRLTIRRLDLAWQPGLALALSGDLDNLGKAAAGRLAATLAADGDTAATRLAALASRLLGDDVPPAFVVARAPFRLAIDATVGAAIGTATGKGASAGTTPSGLAADDVYPTVIVADGTAGSGRLRLTARTAGPLAGWRNQPTHVEARLSGPRPLDVARWLIGDPPATARTTARDERATAERKLPPATVLLSAVGTPARDMKAVARYGAGDLLVADFAGTLSLADGDALAARWSGALNLERADTRILSELLWPPLAGRVAAAPLKGRINLTGGAGDLLIEPQRLQLAGSRLDGRMSLSASNALSGKLAVSKASIGALAGLVLDGGPGTGSGRPGADQRRADEADAAASVPIPWPRAQFDFAHLAGLTANLDLAIDRLGDATGAILARDVKFALALSGDRVVLGDLEARVAEGRVGGRAEFVQTPAGTGFSARIKGSGLPVALFAPSLEAGRRLAGRAELTAELSGRALSPAALAGVLTGSGRLRLADARVPGLTAAALTDLAGKVVAGAVEPEELSERLTALAKDMAIELGAPTLDFTVRNGVVNLPTMVVGDTVASARNATMLSLRDWRFDSRWTVRPAPLPKPEAPEGEMLSLPAVTLIYSGTLGNISAMTSELGIGDLERELVVAKMEANVARLERLRREDEERARQEAERQRLREEEERQAREAERQRIERERAEGLRPEGGQGTGWQSRVKPELPPPAENVSPPARAPRPL